MSISMHLDEYMARRGIVPDDTIVNSDPCAVFDGNVIEDPRLGEGRDDGGPAPATAAEAEAEASEKLERAEETVRDLLG